MIRRIFHRAFVLASVIILLVIIYILTAFQIWQYSLVDETQEADTAIVLGAGSFNGKISPVFEARISHAVWLYQQGYVRKIIFTGGYGVGSNVSESQAAKDYAIKLNIPENDIYIEEYSSTTYGNLYYSYQIMKDNGENTALVISDPLHMKRAVTIARRIGMKAWSSPTPSTKYISEDTKKPFLLRETFLLMLYRLTCLPGGKYLLNKFNL